LGGGLFPGSPPQIQKNIDHPFRVSHLIIIFVPF
jgi:hypothetical protein